MELKSKSIDIVRGGQTTPVVVRELTVEQAFDFAPIVFDLIGIAAESTGNGRSIMDDPLAVARVGGLLRTNKAEFLGLLAACTDRGESVSGLPASVVLKLVPALMEVNADFFAEVKPTAPDVLGQTPQA